MALEYFHSNYFQNDESIIEKQKHIQYTVMRARKVKWLQN